jgi:hypothetical protein
MQTYLPQEFAILCDGLPSGTLDEPLKFEFHHI